VGKHLTATELIAFHNQLRSPLHAAGVPQVQGIADDRHI
jgi:hypothetical protein